MHLTFMQLEHDTIIRNSVNTRIKYSKGNRIFDPSEKVDEVMNEYLFHNSQRIELDYIT